MRLFWWFSNTVSCSCDFLSNTFRIFLLCYTDLVSWIVLSDKSQVKFFKKRELRPRNVHARSNHEYSRSQNRQKSKYCFWWKEHLSDSCQVRSKLGKITPKSIAVRLEQKNWRSYRQIRKLSKNMFCFFLWIWIRAKCWVTQFDWEK